VDWNSEVDRGSSLAKLRGLFIMRRIRSHQGNLETLKDWEFKLIEKLINREETLKIYIHQASNTNYFWISVVEPTTQIIRSYSKDFVDVLNEYIDKYPDINCDFLVLSEDEIYSSDIPKDSIILNVKG
jgi:hypothetical protein